MKAVYSGRARGVAALVLSAPVLLLAWLGGSHPPADAAPRRVGVVVRGGGKDARAIENAVAQALKGHRVTPVKAKALEKAARAAHVALRSEGDLGKVASRLKLAGIVAGEVRDHGKRADLRLHAGDGSVQAKASWSAAGGSRKLAAAVARGFWSRLPVDDVPERSGRSRAAAAAAAEEPVARAADSEPAREAKAPAVAAAAPAAAEAEVSRTRAADKQPEAAPHLSADGSEFDDHPVSEHRRSARASADGVELSSQSDAAEGGGAPLALEAMAGVRVVSRNLTWVKDTSGALSPFSMDNVAAVGFQLAWFPAAHFTTGWPTQFGIAASGEFVPGISARTREGVPYPSSDSDYWGGVRGRMSFGLLDAMATLAYGQHAFLVRSSATASRADLVVPDVKYSYVRIGADGRLHLPAGFSLMAGLAYRAVLDAGTEGYQAQSELYFPRVTVTAIDVSGAVGYRFLAVLEARAGVDLRRYGMNMHPNPAVDMRVVSGGIDQYIAYWFNLAVLLDGRPGGVK